MEKIRLQQYLKKSNHGVNGAPIEFELRSVEKLEGNALWLTYRIATSKGELQ